MNERFEQVALSLWPLAASLLHWCPDAFWNATPAELLGAFPREAGDPNRAMTRADIERLLKEQTDG